MRKLSLLLLVIVLVAAPVLALTPASASVEGPDFSSNPAAAGQTIGVFGRVTNTDDKRHRFEVTFSAVSSCDSTTYVLATTTTNLEGGHSVFISTSWPIPASACAGAYTVSITVEAGNQVLASSSNVLTVTN